MQKPARQPDLVGGKVMKRTKSARTLAIVIVFVTVLGMLPLVAASDFYDNTTVQITVEDSGYPSTISPSQKWFVPEDTIDLTIQVTGTADGLQDVFDILVFGQGETLYAEHVIRFNDVAVDHATGKATVTIPSIMTEALQDDNYDVYVGDEMWIEDSGFDSGRGDWDWTWFRVQMYTIIAETGRSGYIPGDPVTVFYSVVSIKDGSLITDAGYPGWGLDKGEWGVWSEDGESSEGPTNLGNPSGSFTFRLSYVGSSFPDDYVVGIWYNGTYGNTREASKYLMGNAPGFDFRVDALMVDVYTDRAEYQIDSVVSIHVHSWVEGTPVGEPDVDVEISILKGVGPFANKISGYGGDFQTDAAGDVRYMFQLKDMDFEEGVEYTVRINASKWLKETGDSIVFPIVSGSGVISVDVAFDKHTYTTGDTVQMMVDAVSPPGHSTVFTYVYTAYSPSGTYAKETSSSNLYSIDLPSNYEGDMTFKVEVYNIQRDYGYYAETKSIEYGIMLVNVDKDEYDAGDALTVDYELISYLMWAPDFYYIVRDGNLQVVEEGVLSGVSYEGSFTFNVPTTPSSSYTFTVSATSDGRVVSDSDSAYLERGYDLTISFQKSSYLAGETAIVYYEIVPLGGVGLPSSFDLSYALYDFSPKTLATDRHQGDLSYPIPAGIPDGTYLFIVEEWVTGSFAIETIAIGPEGTVIGAEDFDGDGVPDSADSDDDNDGYSDVIEDQEGSDPKNATSKPPDNDEDYIPDSMDVDDDNDGFSDGEELLAGSDPMSSTSVPEPQAGETDPATSNPWEWLAPLILAVIALVMASIVLIRSGRPPRKEALLDDGDTTEIDEGPSQ